MIVELQSFNGREFYLSESGWQVVVQLVRTQGVELPATPEVALSAEEAEELARGMQRGIARVAARGREESPLLRAMFSQRSMGHWQGFIAFCRLGGFRVERSVA
jgi:hypothetical protein